MSLRTKVLVIIGLLLLSVIAILFGISQGIFLNSYIVLEKQEAERIVRRAMEAINQKATSLGNTTKIIALWFSEDYFGDLNNDQAFRDMFSDDVLSSMDIDIILIADEKGMVIHSSKKNTIPGIPATDALALEDYIHRNNELLKQREESTPVSGMIDLPDVPILAAINTIKLISGNTSLRYYIIAGIYLDDIALAQLSTSTQLSETLMPLDSSAIPGELKLGTISRMDETIYIDLFDENTLAGYTAIGDIWGNPKYLLRVEMPRDTYQKGVAGIRYFVLSLLAGSLVFGAATIFILEKYVLRRLSRLERSVNMIRTSGSTSSRIVIGGNDELSSLGREINHLLDSLQQYHWKVEELDESLKLSMEYDKLDLWFLDLRTWKLDWQVHSGKVLQKNVHPELPVAYSDMLEGYIHPEDKDRVDKELKKYLNGWTHVFQEECRLLKSPGQWKKVIITARIVLRDSYAKPLRVAGICQDIK